jgi:UDP:flavonoid glycosyltransferase YjiC (YdhE family)
MRRTLFSLADFIYAARVRYHSLGLSGDVRGLSSRSILELVSTVLEDQAYKRRAQRMQRRRHEMQEQSLAAKLISSMVE